MPPTRSAATVVAAAVLLAGCGGPSGVPLGEAIPVSYTDAAGQTTTMDVTTTGIRTGTIEELEAEGLQFDDDERDLVPHYVDATYANTGDATVDRTMRVTLEDGDGNRLSPTVILDFAGTGEGAGGPCVDVKEPPLAPGDAFDDCTLFLVPEGVEPATAAFLSQPAEGEPDFVHWVLE